MCVVPWNSLQELNSILMEISALLTVLNKYVGFALFMLDKIRKGNYRIIKRIFFFILKIFIVSLAFSVDLL